ncbi:M15 family metallopeptidase [Cytobacillus sp. Hm23]
MKFFTLSRLFITSTFIGILLISGCSNGSVNLQDEEVIATEGTETVEENVSNQENESLQENLTDEEEIETATDEAQQDEDQNNQSSDNSEDLVSLEQFNNVIEEQNGLKVIMNPENILSIVNKEQSLPSDYIPDDLVVPNVAFSFGDQILEKSYLRSEAALALEEMFKQASLENITLYAVSGYRSFERQNELFTAEVAKYGKEKASQAVAVPGHSEHQTGLTMDISSQSVNFLLTTDFADTIEGQWVENNAHLFGFIVRYPKDQVDITGYQYEPWHIRYVGKDVAKVLYDNNIILDSILNE